MVAEIGRQQFAVWSRAQVLEAGGNDGFIKRRLRSGAWARRLPGVYGYPGVQDSYPRRLWTAHLAAGPTSVVSHEAAAALHGLTGFPRGPLVLTAGHPFHHRLPDVFVHQIDDLAPRWTGTRYGLPVTVPARTLVDLCVVCSRARLGVALDDAVQAKKTTFGQVGGCLKVVMRPGKPGLHKLAFLLDERGPGYVPPQSELERMMFEVLDRGGLPKPRRQFAHPGREIVAGCVDAAYPDCKLILEADGRRWHTRIQDIKRDHHRDRAAARVGWETLRILWEDLRDDPEGVVDDVREIRTVRLESLRQ